MKRVLSPLRYPGSKARIVDLIVGLLEKNLLVGSHIYEPFAGGAAISLNLLARGFVRSATWIERDPLVYAFWKCVQDNPDGLIDRLQNRKITLAAWRRMQSLREVKNITDAPIEELGYAGLFFNRTCFSGVIGAGPIGGMSQQSEYKINCRFNKVELGKSIRLVSKVTQNVDLHFGDGIAFLDSGEFHMEPHSFAYIDPPYVLNGHKMYRYFFGKAEHERLAAVVSDMRIPWLLSYDSCDLIRELYREELTFFVKTYQTLKGVKFVNELLMLSSDFELPHSVVSSESAPASFSKNLMLELDTD